MDQKFIPRFFLLNMIYITFCNDGLHSFLRPYLLLLESYNFTLGMRVIAYNILGPEKEHLAKANGKVHDLTLISNELNFSTMHYAMGKEAIIISDRDLLDRVMLYELYKIGIRNIITRSRSTEHIDLDYAGELKMHVANVPYENTLEGIARETISNLTQWMVGGCTGDACQCRIDCKNKVNLRKYGNGDSKQTDQQI